VINAFTGICSRLRTWMAGVAAVSLFAFTTTVAGGTQVSSHSDESLEYARLFGVSPGVASQRVALMNETGRVAEELSELASSAGVWFQHEEHLVLVAAFKGDTDRDQAEKISRGAKAIVALRFDAAFTFEELRQAQDQLVSKIYDLNIDAGVGLDLAKNAVVLDLQPGSPWSGQHAVLLDALGVHSGPTVLVTESASRIVLQATQGGKRISTSPSYWCTTGFTVSGVFNTGVLTAAHCNLPQVAQPTGRLDFPVLQQRL
jgi:hypothetical protein